MLTRVSWLIPAAILFSSDAAHAQACENLVNLKLPYTLITAARMQVQLRKFEVHSVTVGEDAQGKARSPSNTTVAPIAAQYQHQYSRSRRASVLGSHQSH